MKYILLFILLVRAAMAAGLPPAAATAKHTAPSKNSTARTAVQENSSTTKKVPADTAAATLWRAAGRKIVLSTDTSIKVRTDTNRTARQFAFTTLRSTGDVVAQEPDTTLARYYVDYPFLRQDAGAVFLGNLGSPVLYHDYFKRQHSHEFLFAQPYAPYFATPNNAVHYNTTTPYSVLMYEWTSNRRTEEVQLHAQHAQNITNALSFGVNFYNYGTKGIYQRQYTKTLALNAFVSYFGRYYSANGGFLYNRVSMQENGGITDEDIIFDDNFDRPEGAEVRLAQARTQLWNTNYYLSHGADFPLLYLGNDSVITNVIKARVGHSFEWAAWRRLYTDNEQEGSELPYYTNFFLNKTQSRDSIALRRMENRIFVQLRPLRAYIFEQVAAGIGWRRYSTYMFAPSMYLTGNAAGGMSSVFAYASMSAWYKRYFLWRAYAESVMAGYDAGNILLNGELKLSLFPINDGVHILVRAELNSHSPSFFYQNFQSNHYQWSALNRVTETTLEAAVSIPQSNTHLSFKYGLHAQYLYFDEQKALRQSSTPINVAALEVRQNFRLWHFHFNHRAMLQKSSSDALPLPLVSTNFTYFFNYDFTRQLGKKVVRIELGVDVRYATPYKGYGYDPALGAFHNSDATLGGYLWADLFLAAQWYRAAPFVKWEHANQNLLPQPYGFWAAAHYPRNFRVFKFGLAWRFFD